MPEIIILSHPGWEVSIIRRELFTDGYGFVVDYLAEALTHLRALDFSDDYTPHFKLSDNISTRDRDGVRKTFSGLMKLIHPHRAATVAETEELLRFAVEGRKRVNGRTPTHCSRRPMVSPPHRPHSTIMTACPSRTRSGPTSRNT